MKNTRNYRNRFFGRVGQIQAAFLLMVVVVLLFGIPGHTRAEEEAEDYMLEETTVTATKVGETKLQETPMSITAFSDEHLKGTHAFNLTELSQFVPNAQFDLRGPFVTGFIRGIGSVNLWMSGSQKVGFYLDGLYLLKGFGANADFFDVERIEVLRGPQGTLYGRNSVGGSVNIITKRPSDEFELKIGVEAGNYDKVRVDGMISGPIVKDKVKVRLSFSDSAHDGYVDNLIGSNPYDEDYTAMRGALQFTPTDKVEIRLGADYRKSDNHAFPNKLIYDQGVFGGLLAPMFGIPNSVLIPEDFWEVRHDVSQDDDEELWGVSGSVDIELSDSMALHSITGYREYERYYIIDMDGSVLPLSHAALLENVQQFSQELQLDGNWNRWKWILGGYYYHADDDAPFVENRLEFLGPGFVLYNKSNIVTDAYALFANVIYDINDKLSLDAGVRYSYEEKKIDFEQSTSFPHPFLPSFTLEEEDNWSAITPKFGVNYRATDDMLLFGTISRGFKSGGFFPTNPPGTSIDLDPEFIWSYEIGLKSDWFDRRLRANLTAFWSDYTDIQESGGVQGVPIVTNAAEATVKGAELELLARPVPPLTLSCSVSYLDAKYDEFITVDSSGNVVDVSGNTLIYAPEWKLNLGAQYVIPVYDYGFLTLRGDLTWTDDQHFFSALNNPLAGQEAYTLVNGRVRFETAGGHWSFDIYGKNLGETEYLRNVMALTPLDPVGNIGPPRTFGIQVVYEY
ncbi:MAG: TonB-dependent receptor [Deltaproteobacteria bacterium]|nr:TonB-dependent receptor [Deltaproteobacteria bacterium]